MAHAAGLSIPGSWPHRETSRLVQASGLTWHVQRAGAGAPLLLVHGTGSASLSYRDALVPLSTHFDVIVPDLPGHGLTQHPGIGRLSLPGMAGALADLLDVLGARPVLAAGHSAGAAILARMALDGRIAPEALVSINGALLPLRGMPGWLFSPLARALAMTPFVSTLLSRWAAEPRQVRRLLADTGSRLDERGVELYTLLLTLPDHVAAALGMMASWDLEPLARELARLPVPLDLLVADGDRTVPPSESERVRALVPGARRFSLGPLGHLAHEEEPQRLIAHLLARGAARSGAML